MNHKEALVTLYRGATSSYALPVGNCRLLYNQVLQELENPKIDSTQIETIQAEKTDLLLRVAELEEQLAEAQAPKRRTSRKKNDQA